MKKGFGLITFLLIMVIVFSTTGTVMGMEKGKAGVDEKFYRQVEREYVSRVRSYLNEGGFENSGVALTKVIYEDGRREYTLNVHHKRIERLDPEGKSRLSNDLEALKINEEGICIKDLLVVFS